MKNTDVIEAAQKFCRRYNISEYPVMLEPIYTALGFKVFTQKLPKDVSGFIVAQKDNFHDYDSPKVIVVNSSESGARKRFTVMHEIAHYVLHRDNADEVYAHRDAGQNSRMETEANLFAANVLMPQELIDDALENMSNMYWFEQSVESIIQYIASKFAVSTEAAAVRLRQLQYI